MSTKPITYRIDEDVDAELRRLGEVHGGVNRALLHLLEMNIAPELNRKRSKKEKAVAELAASDLTAQAVERNDIEYGSAETAPRGQHIATLGAVANSAGSIQGKASVETWRASRKPLLRPKDRR